MSDDENVVAISGGQVISTGEPDPDVIEMLENFLAMARAGDLRGACVAAFYVDNTTSYDWQGVWNAHAMIGTVEMIKARLIQTKLRLDIETDGE